MDRSKEICSKKEKEEKAFTVDLEKVSDLHIPLNKSATQYVFEITIKENLTLPIHITCVIISFQYVFGQYSKKHPLSNHETSMRQKKKIYIKSKNNCTKQRNRESIVCCHCGTKD